MSHYISNLRDVEFNLFEVLRVQDRLGRGPYAQLDEQTAREILREVERLASGPFADSFVEGDRTPLQLDEQGDVTLPDGGIDLQLYISRVEHELIRRALEKTGGNKGQASRLLNLKRTTLIEKRKRLEPNQAAD